MSPSLGAYISRFEQLKQLENLMAPAPTAGKVSELILYYELSVFLVRKGFFLKMKRKRTEMWLIIVVSCMFFKAWGDEDNYRINQVGYYPSANKIAIIIGAVDSVFEVIDARDSVVFRDILSEEKTAWRREWQEAVKQADFSALTEPGTYWIRTEGLGTSYPFRISNRIYADAAAASLKSFYYQRASMELEPQYAGKFARPAGHPDTAVVYHSSTGKDGGKASSPGGWYDAGDYGKYIVNAGITVGTLLQFYEMFGTYFGDSVLNIPESGNSQDDLLDEVRYELEWMKTMQDSDGGVFHKLTTLNFTGTEMPHEANATRYFIGKSTAATLDFAAVMAMAGRIYVALDSTFAAGCLAQAESAWVWAEENPSELFDENPSGVGTGAYEDEQVADERLWAATELFITTGKEEYRNIVVENLYEYRYAPRWQFVKSMSPLSLAIADNELDSASFHAIKSSFIVAADELLDEIETYAYRIPRLIFNWGSNSFLANDGLCLVVAYTLTEDKKYIKGAAECIDYLLGKNATTHSFLTGFGLKAARNPHHRPSGADGIEEMIPGFLVGGPNGGAGDYEDVYGSYTTNEVAINWSSPMTALLAAVDAVMGEGPRVEQTMFAINISVEGPGSVLVEPNQKLFEKGSSVQLTAVSDSGEIFRGWSGAEHGEDTTITLTVDKDLSIRAGFGLVDEIVRNGDFSDGDNEWSVTYHEGGLGREYVSDSGVFVLDIRDGGEVGWGVQMTQLGIELIQGGVYEFSFDAWADTSRIIVADVGMSSDPYESYTGDAETEITLSDQPQNYSFTFTMVYPTDDQARIGFYAGLSDRNVYIDNVKLKMQDKVELASPFIRKSGQAAFFARTKGSKLMLDLLLKRPSASSLKMYSVSGKLVKDLSAQLKQLSTGRHTLNLQNTLGSGMYVIRYFDGAGHFTQPVSIIAER